MCTTDTLQTVLKELYHRVAGIYGNDLHKVILYGSYARGDYDSESDIDVMVLVHSDVESIKKRGWDIAVIDSRLSLEYDVTLSVTVKNKAHFDHWKESLPYFRNVVAEGVEIYD